jgi:hypothetical protein
MPILKVVLFCYGMDPLLGRLDYASMPQQALMEMFIDGIENREKICGSKEEPADIEKWEGVRLNENGDVTKITCVAMNLEGSVNVQWLPSTIERFQMDNNRLTGTIDLTSLPPPMKYIYLSDNHFTGTIDLCHLPECFQFLNLTVNNLNGTLNLENLPQSLYSLSLGHNEFSGTVSLVNLPDGLKQLAIQSTKISGRTDFSKLPNSLAKFNFSNTQLSGEIFVDSGKTFYAQNSNVKIHRKQ